MMDEEDGEKKGPEWESKKYVITRYEPAMGELSNRSRVITRLLHGSSGYYTVTFFYAQVITRDELCNVTRDSCVMLVIRVCYVVSVT